MREGSGYEVIRMTWMILTRNENAVIRKEKHYTKLISHNGKILENAFIRNNMEFNLYILYILCVDTQRNSCQVVSVHFF